MYSVEMSALALARLGSVRLRIGFGRVFIFNGHIILNKREILQVVFFGREEHVQVLIHV